MSVTAEPIGQSALLTDLYQLTMLDAYYREGMEQTAVFEFFVRRLPHTRNFLVAAGLEQVLDYLETLHFTTDELDWLDSTGRFSDELLQRLASFRFTGDVFAMPEGTVFFANEPVLRVVAPLPQAQFVESRIVNLLHYQTLVASKAARARLVTRRQLIDFGMRRAHGAEAAVYLGRAAYIAGFDATATLEVSRRYGVPAVGTMAHSFVQAHDGELEAFRAFAQAHPTNVVLLIDTFDTIRGAQRAAQVAKALRSEGIEVIGVRIDSGDLATAATRVRSILDHEGCRDVRILVSGGLDEHTIAALQAANAPIDGFCLGTRIAVSEDAPSLDCAYKLQQYAGRPRRKRSQWKETWPGPHQVYRQYDPHGCIGMDLLGRADEPVEGRTLLHEVMVRGRPTGPAASLDEVRSYCADELAALPPMLKSLEQAGYSPVKISQALRALAAETDRANP